MPKWISSVDIVVLSVSYESACTQQGTEEESILRRGMGDLKNIVMYYMR